MTTTKAYGKGKSWPPATPKPLNQPSPKFAQVITSWTYTTVRNFIQIGQGHSLLRMHDFAHHCLLNYFWLYPSPRAKTPPRTSTQNNGSAQGCAFSLSQNQNLTFTPSFPPFPPKPPFWTWFRWYLEIFGRKTALTLKVLTVNGS